MRGLCHGVRKARVDRTAQANASGQFGGEIGEDVAEHVGGDYDIESFGRTHYVGHHRIDDHLVDCDFRKLAAHGATYLQKHAIAEFKHIGLVHQRHLIAAALRQFEAGTGNALAAFARDAAQRHHHIGRDQHFAAARGHVAIRIKTLGVLAHDHQVKRVHASRHARVGARRADVGEQVEVFAEKHRRIDLPLTLVDVGVGGAQDQAIGFFHLFHQFRCHRLAVALEAFQAGHIMIERDAEIEFPRGSFHCGNRDGSDFGADTVSGQDYDAHEVSFLIPA